MLRWSGFLFEVEPVVVSREIAILKPHAITSTVPKDCFVNIDDSLDDLNKVILNTLENPQKHSTTILSNAIPNKAFVVKKLLQKNLYYFRNYNSTLPFRFINPDPTDDVRRNQAIIRAISFATSFAIKEDISQITRFWINSMSNNDMSVKAILSRYFTSLHLDRETVIRPSNNTADHSLLDNLLNENNNSEDDDFLYPDWVLYDFVKFSRREFQFNISEFRLGPEYIKNGDFLILKTQSQIFLDYQAQLKRQSRKRQRDQYEAQSIDQIPISTNNTIDLNNGDISIDSTTQKINDIQNNRDLVSEVVNEDLENRDLISEDITEADEGNQYLKSSEEVDEENHDLKSSEVDEEENRDLKSSDKVDKENHDLKSENEKSRDLLLEDIKKVREESSDDEENIESKEINSPKLINQPITINNPSPSPSLSPSPRQNLPITNNNSQTLLPLIDTDETRLIANEFFLVEKMHFRSPYSLESLGNGDKGVVQLFGTVFRYLDGFPSAQPPTIDALEANETISFLGVRFVKVEKRVVNFLDVVGGYERLMPFFGMGGVYDRFEVSRFGGYCFDEDDESFTLSDRREKVREMGEENGSVEELKRLFGVMKKDLGYGEDEW